MSLDVQILWPASLESGLGHVPIVEAAEESRQLLPLMTQNVQQSFSARGVPAGQRFAEGHAEGAS